MSRHAVPISSKYISHAPLRSAACVAMVWPIELVELLINSLSWPRARSLRNLPLPSHCCSGDVALRDEEAPRAVAEQKRRSHDPNHNNGFASRRFG